MSEVKREIKYKEIEKRIFKTALIVLLALMFSCKTQRAIIKAPIKEEGPKYLFDQLKKNEMQYDWLSAKFAVDYIVDKKKISFKGQIRIKKDSIIWISISPALGIEMVRLLITIDSIKLLNRIDGLYFMDDFEYINRFINGVLDFNMLQSFLIGNDFSFYENGKFKASIDGQEYRLSTAGRSKLKKYVKKNRGANKIPIQNTWLNPENFKITSVMIKEVKQEGRKLTVKYSNFQTVDDQLFPHYLDFDISSEKNIKINIQYSKVVVDVPKQFPFKIPKKYTRMN